MINNLLGPHAGRIEEIVIPTDHHELVRGRGAAAVRAARGLEIIEGDF